MDPISKTYIKMYLNEMAFEINQDTTRLGEQSYRRKFYAENENLPVHKTFSNGVKLLKQVKDDQTHYITVDPSNKEALHHNKIKNMKNNNIYHFPYEYQDEVSRHNTDKLPKGHATDILYDHFKENDIPLRTSDVQMPQGHKMWGRILDRALQDGHHAYYIDRLKLTPITHDNKDECYKNYFGRDLKCQHRHLLISKRPIEEYKKS